MNYADIVEKIKDRRQELHMSQYGLSARCGIKQPSIARIEKGKEVQVKTLLKLCKALNLKIELVSL